MEFMPVSRRELLSDATFAESSATVAERVEAARCRAAARLRDTPWRLNAEVPGSELRRRFAFNNRFGKNLGGTGRARKVKNDPGLAGGQQAEAESLHKRDIGERPDSPDRRIELKIHFRDVDDNAIR